MWRTSCVTSIFTDAGDVLLRVVLLELSDTPPLRLVGHAHKYYRKIAKTICLNQPHLTSLGENKTQHTTTKLHRPR